MKRIVFLFIAVALFITANAQIRDTFWGCKLGETTKEQLVENLKANGMECQSVKSGKAWYVRNVKFAGRLWDTCIFELYENKLMQISFLAQKEKSKEEVADIYNQTVENLKTKYPKVKVVTVWDEESRKSLAFEDANTILSISYVLSENRNTALLVYQNVQLSGNKKDAIDDL